MKDIENKLKLKNDKLSENTSVNLENQYSEPTVTENQESNSQVQCLKRNETELEKNNFISHGESPADKSSAEILTASKNPIDHVEEIAGNSYCQDVFSVNTDQEIHERFVNVPENGDHHNFDDENLELQQESSKEPIKNEAIKSKDDEHETKNVEGKDNESNGMLIQRNEPIEKETLQESFSHKHTKSQNNIINEDIFQKQEIIEENTQVFEDSFNEANLIDEPANKATDSKIEASDKSNNASYNATDFQTTSMKDIKQNYDAPFEKSIISLRGNLSENEDDKEPENVRFEENKEPESVKFEENKEPDNEMKHITEIDDNEEKQSLIVQNNANLNEENRDTIENESH